MKQRPLLYNQKREKNKVHIANPGWQKVRNTLGAIPMRNFCQVFILQWVELESDTLI